MQCFQPSQRTKPSSIKFNPKNSCLNRNTVTSMQCFKKFILLLTRFFAPFIKNKPIHTPYSELSQKTKKLRTRERNTFAVLKLQV